MHPTSKARIAIFQLSDHAYDPTPFAPNRILPLTVLHAEYPVTRDRIDAYLCISNLRVPVRMSFAIYIAPVDAERVFVAASDELDVDGDGNGRAIEVIVRAKRVTIPRAGRYEVYLLANGKRVKTQAVRFGVGRGQLRGSRSAGSRLRPAMVVPGPHHSADPAPNERAEEIVVPRTVADAASVHGQEHQEPGNQRNQGTSHRFDPKDEECRNKWAE